MREGEKGGWIPFTKLNLAPWLRELISEVADEYDLDVTQLGFQFLYTRGKELEVYYTGKPRGSILMGELTQWGTYEEHTREQIEDDMRKVFMRIAREARPATDQRIISLLEQILEKLDEIRQELEV